MKKMLFGQYEPLIYHKMGPSFIQIFNFFRLGLYVLFLVSSLAGLFRGHYLPLLISWSLVLYLILIHSLMHVEPRYFLEAYPFMLLPFPSLFVKRNE